MPDSGVNFGRVEWDSDEEFSGLRTQVDRVAKSGDDARSLFEMYERRFRYYYVRLFQTEGASGEGAWTGISAKWREYKRKHGRPTQIGIYEDYMHQSFIGGKGYMSKITKNKAVFGQKPGGKSTKYTHYFDRARSLDMSRKETRIWQDMADKYFSAKVGKAFDPHGKVHNVDLGNGYKASIGSDGIIRYHGAGGRFVGGGFLGRVGGKMRGREA